MSILRDVREALLAVDTIIATETHATAYPFYKDIGASHIGEWTHAVVYKIIPRHEADESKLRAFGLDIVKRLPAAFRDESTSPMYGRFYRYEKIGTLTERMQSTIHIDDPDVPGYAELRGGVRTEGPTEKPTTLYRMIKLEFCPAHHLYLMACAVEAPSRHTAWLHEPSQQQLENMKAGIGQR